MFMNHSCRYGRSLPIFRPLPLPSPFCVYLYQRILSFTFDSIFTHIISHRLSYTACPAGFTNHQLIHHLLEFHLVFCTRKRSFPIIFVALPFSYVFLAVPLSGTYAPIS